MGQWEPSNEIRINGLPYRTTGPVVPTLLAQWPGKVLTGDVTSDSHPLLSTWSLDVSGGMGVHKLRPDDKAGHSFVSTAETRYFGQIGRRPRQIIVTTGFGNLSSTDSFNRADNATSLGSTDGGAVRIWVNVVNNMGISSNQAYSSSASAGTHAVAAVVFNSLDVDVRVTLATVGSGGGIVVRLKDANNFIELYNNGSADYRVDKVVGGVRTNLAILSVTPNNGDTLRVTTRVDRCVVYINGVLRANLQITDANLLGAGAVSHGLAAYNGTTSRLDNFSISEYEPVSLVDAVAYNYSDARRAYFFTSDRRVLIDNTSDGSGTLTVAQNGGSGFFLDNLPTSTLVFLNGNTPWLFVATGDSIWKTQQGTSWIQDTANALFLVTWDNSFWRLTETGQLYRAADPHATPMTWDAVAATIPGVDGTYRYITSCFVAKDETGTPAIYATTVDALWKFDGVDDWIGPLFQWARHPHGGRGSIEYPAEVDSIIIPVGLNVYQYVPGVPAEVRNISPTRFDGLDKQMAGAITKLVRTPQFLAAIVTNDGEPTSTVSTVLAYTGAAPGNLVPTWHCVGLWAVTPTASTNLSSMAYVDAWDQYRLYYSFKDQQALFYQRLYPELHNPRTNPAAEFDTLNQYVYTPWFPLPRTSISKLALRLTVRVTNATANDYIEVGYQTDVTLTINDAWTTLTNTTFPDGKITTAGRTVFTFGDAGIEYEQIRFRIGVLAGASPSNSQNPTVEYFEFEYLPVMPPSWSFAAELDLSGPYGNRTPQAMFEELRALALPGTLVPVVINGDTYYCRLLGLDGQSYLGDERGRVQVTLVQPIAT